MHIRSFFKSHLLLLLFALCAATPASFSQVKTKINVEKEVLEYEVSYLGITLGRVTAIAQGFDTLKGKKVWRAKAFIQTASGIPFVKVNTIYNTWMDTNMTHSHEFYALEEEDEGRWHFDKYMFDYSTYNLTAESGTDSVIEESENISFKGKWNDGLSLFYFAREFLHSGRGVAIPTMVLKKMAKTDIYYTKNIEETDIDAVDYAIRTKYLKGQAHWEGIYGLSGKFEGWFSDDEAAIPIRAKMKVYIGSVNIELVKWDRPGWTPPSAE